MSPSREVPLAQREADEEQARIKADAASAAYVEARASGNPARVAAADAALAEAVAAHRRASRRLEDTVKRLKARAGVIDRTEASWEA